MKNWLAIALCVVGMHTRAQDPNFTHFYNNTLYYNPAATAIHGGFRLTGNVRALWTNVPSNFNTAFLGIEAEAPNKTCLGLSFLHAAEGEGRLNTNSLGLYYSYRPIETRNFLVQAGFQTTLVSKHIDFTRFVFSDQLDEIYGNINGTSFIAPNNGRIFYPDFGAGVMMMLNSPNHQNNDLKLLSTLGFAAHHLTTPRDAFFNTGGLLPIKWVLNAQSSIFYHNVVYAPAFIWEKQGPFSTFSIGLNAVLNPVYAGLWIRNRTASFTAERFDAFMFNLGSNFVLENGSKLKVCYSYDFTISRLRSNTMGSHEITLIYEVGDYLLFEGLIQRKKNRYKTRFLNCVDGF
jgi:type IX secretion system PorP/SprF family membrane protein